MEMENTQAVATEAPVASEVTQEVTSPDGGQTVESGQAENAQTATSQEVDNPAKDGEKEKTNWKKGKEERGERIALEKARKEAEEKAKKLNEKHEKALQALKQVGYDDVDAVFAEKEGITVEQYRTRESEKQKAIAESEAVQKLTAQNQGMQSALKFIGIQQDINKAYPDDKVDVTKLGKTFFDMVTKSGIDGVEAYEMIKSRQKPIPPSIGSTKSQTATQGDYYTRDQVKKMSRSEVKANYEKIKKSQLKW
ncbi:MAG: hypothetical protein R3Y18_00145 [Bacillota bacterium]